MNGPAYLLLDEFARPFDLTWSIDDANALAQVRAKGGRVYLDAPTEQDVEAIEAGEAQEIALAANPSIKPRLRVVGPNRILTAPDDALAALRAAMKRRPNEPVFDYAAARNMDVEDAYRRLVPLFPRIRYKRTGKSIRVGTYDQAVGTTSKKGMAFAILGQNYKTAKGTPAHIITQLRERTGFRQANVLGLSLLPQTQTYTEPMVKDIMAGAREFFGVGEVRPVRLNACVRATPQCAASCLVFSGRNLAEDYNTVKKYALVQALVHEPQAFMRMLIEAIRIHRETSFRLEVMPLVRLNVFSDLPWELMAPELFDGFPDVQFYDYTKVPNRKPPPNYDLTFSFAGTDQNVEAMDHEIREQHRRVAVVFAATGIRVIAGEKVEIPKAPRYMRRLPGSERLTPHYARLPETFLGLPVIDGDESDMRPYDPAPSIVGLRWKNPANQNVTLEQARVFIVLVDLVQGPGGYYDAVVSKTARFDDVDYTKYAAEED